MKDNLLSIEAEYSLLCMEAENKFNSGLFEHSSFDKNRLVLEVIEQLVATSLQDVLDLHIIRFKMLNCSYY